MRLLNVVNFQLNKLSYHYTFCLLEKKDKKGSVIKVYKTIKSNHFYIYRQNLRRFSVVSFTYCMLYIFAYSLLSFAYGIRKSDRL